MELDGSFEWFVEGVPVAQPRQRHAPIINGKGLVFEKRAGKLVPAKACQAIRCDPKTRRPIVTNYIPNDHPIHAWKKVLQVETKIFMKESELVIADRPIAVDLFFVFPRPISKTKKSENQRLWHGVKPDKDNLEKAVFDALNEIAWSDDKLIVAGDTSKTVAGDGDQTGVAIRVRPSIDVKSWADSLVNPNLKQESLF